MFTLARIGWSQNMNRNNFDAKNQTPVLHRRESEHVALSCSKDRERIIAFEYTSHSSSIIAMEIVCIPKVIYFELN